MKLVRASNELEILLDLDLSDASLEQVLHEELGSDFAPSDEGASNKDWLEDVASKFRTALMRDGGLSAALGPALRTPTEADDPMRRQWAERFPNLYGLFAGYFHQDWSMDHGTTDDLIRAYIGDQPESTVRAARHELRELLSLDLSDEELERVLDPGLRSDFTASDIGESNMAWLQAIADQLQRALAEGDHSRDSR
jgi:hypothetical protein